MPEIENILGLLVEIGLLDVILPFLLIFALTFGILQRNKVLGGKRNIDAMVAFCVGFLALAATSVLNIVNILVGWLVLGLVVSIMFALILGLAGAKIQSNKYMTGLAIAVFAIMTLIGLNQAGLINQQQLQSAVLLPLILSGALIGVLIYVLNPGKKSDSTSEPKKEPTQQNLKPHAKIKPEGEGVLWKEPGS